MRLPILPLIRLLALLASLAIVMLCVALLLIFVPQGVSEYGMSIFDRDVVTVFATTLAFAVLAFVLWLQPKTPQWRRNALVAMALLVASPFAALAWFDASWFYPRLQHARAGLANPPANEDARLTTLIEAGYGRGLEYSVAKMVMFQPGFDSESVHRNWPLRSLASTWMVELHCNRAEQRALFAKYSYVGKHGTGLQAAAREMYGAEISALDAEQLSMVVACPTGRDGWKSTRSGSPSEPPNSGRHCPPRLDGRRDHFFANASLKKPCMRNTLRL